MDGETEEPNSDATTHADDGSGDECEEVDPVDYMGVVEMMHGFEDDTDEDMDGATLSDSATLTSAATLTDAATLKGAATLFDLTLDDHASPSDSPSPGTNNEGITAADMPLSSFGPSEYAACQPLSQISVGGLEISEASQRAITRSFNEDDSAFDESDDDVRKDHSGGGAQTNDTRPADDGLPPPDVPQQRDVNIMNLPAPVAVGRPRQKKRQSWASVATMQRYVTVTYPRDLTANVNDVVQWAKHTRRLKNVLDILGKYPCIMDEQGLRGKAPIVKEEPKGSAADYSYSFIIPQDLVNALEAAIRDFMRKKDRMEVEKRNAPVLINFAKPASSTEEKDIVVWLKKELVPFSRDCVVDMQAFYYVKRKCSLWQRDMRWLGQDWGSVSGRPIEFFASKTGASGRCSDELKVLNANMAMEIFGAFEKACLQSRFSLSNHCSIRFEEIVGYVGGDRWLNDSVIGYGLAAMSEKLSGVTVLYSHLVNCGFPTASPSEKLFSMKYIVLPVNHTNIHWTLIIVSVKPYGMLAVHMYDPMSGRPYKSQTEEVWEQQLLPFLKRWHADRFEDGDHVFPPDVHDHWIGTPTQPDGSNCGVMVLGVVHTYIRGHGGFEMDAVTKEYVKVMRLRLLWVIMMRSHINPIDPDEEKEAVETDKELTNKKKNQTNQHICKR